MNRTPIHPGIILGEELDEIGISAAELARQIKIPPNRISQIIAGRRNITADTALRLGKWFGMSAAFWLNLQKSYELRLAQKDIGKELNKITTRKREQTHTSAHL
ncbi:MAG: addiction module antidote protein, HigA family [Gammaproteobacteria bacterium]|nr:MAG: addiction module antidote protein, HigA family [Gammaproteobacteria bacterium]